MDDLANHVLFIDDNLDMCDLVTIMLQREGFRVATAHNSQDSLEFIKTQKVDLIVTDLHFRDCEGIEHIRQLRRLEPSVPLLVISGDSEVDSKRSAIAAGATEYLLKPTALYDLPEHLAQLME